MFPLEVPPLPTASPPKGGDRTLERKPLVSWFPLWGEGGAQHQKGHARREKDSVGIAENAANLYSLRTLRNLSNLSVTAHKNTPYPPARLRPPAPSWGRGSSASGYSCRWRTSEPSEPFATCSQWPVASGQELVARDWGLGIRKPETVNLKPNKEMFPLEVPPLPTASPPKGGDETPERKTLASWFPLFGGKVVQAPKGAC